MTPTTVDAKKGQQNLAMALILPYRCGGNPLLSSIMIKMHFPLCSSVRAKLVSPKARPFRIDESKEIDTGIF